MKFLKLKSLFELYSMSLWKGKRFKRFSERLKKGAVTAALTGVLLLNLPLPAFAQGIGTFTEQIGGNNPLDGFDAGVSSAPTFIDIDNDGDFDAFSGESGGAFKFYENTGDISNPVFTERTGTDNPLNLENVGAQSVPTFVNIDGDGDFDAFSGENNGIFKYYENTGNRSNPVFTE